MSKNITLEEKVENIERYKQDEGVDFALGYAAYAMNTKLARKARNFVRYSEGVRQAEIELGNSVDSGMLRSA